MDQASAVSDDTEARCSFLSDQVFTDGEGFDLVPYTAGGAFLSVTLRAPAYDDDHVDTFDGSFEGYTTFAVGVRARLPFRVLLLAGPGTHSRIVIDVAHRW